MAEKCPWWIAAEPEMKVLWELREKAAEREDYELAVMYGRSILKRGDEIIQSLKMHARPRHSNAG